MTITAEIVADSISKEGKRLTTFRLRYPRFIHAEELTHRLLDVQPELVIYEAIPDGLMYDQNLSRNASSSRAIPIKRMIEDLRRDPVIPIHWGAHQPGMQASSECDNTVDIGKFLNLPHYFTVDPEPAWLAGMHKMIQLAEAFAAAGYHKQFVNRLLEPWMHINVVCTATDYENFFALRRHKDAQPEIKMLADKMWEARENNIPQFLKPGEWHLPFYGRGYWKPFEGSKYDSVGCTLNIAIKTSVANSARTSYMTHEGRPATEAENTNLYDRLLGSTPLHASPAEHQATPDTCYNFKTHAEIWAYPLEWGNLKGFRQYRKMLPNEYVPG
jgi:hypothetical protein